MRLTTLLATLLLTAALGADAAAQVLDGEWFRVRVSYRGRTYDADAGKSVSTKLKTPTLFGRLVATEGGSEGGVSYGALLGAVLEPGEGPVVAGGVMLETLGPDETTGLLDFTGIQLALGDKGPEVVGAFEAQAVVDIKAKVKNEELRSARIRPVGAVAESQVGDPPVPGLGTVKASITRVPESKVPFPTGMGLTFDPADGDAREVLEAALAQAWAKRAAIVEDDAPAVTDATDQG